MLLYCSVCVSAAVCVLVLLCSAGRAVIITAEEEAAVAAEEGVITTVEPQLHRHRYHLPSDAVPMWSQQSQMVHDLS